MQTGRKKRLPRTLRRQIIQTASFCAAWFLLTSTLPATFLRLGPFDFTAGLGLDGIYSTNVEREREESDVDVIVMDTNGQVIAESVLDTEEPAKEDYYGVLRLTLDSSAEMSPNTTLSLGTGLAIEKHAEREDLDNSSNPFGRVDLQGNTRFRHTSLDFKVLAERTSESAEDVFVPGGRKKRDVNDRFSYGAGVSWDWRALSLNGGYDFNSERHDEEQFRAGDQDETTWTFGAGLRPTRLFNLTYSYERTKTEQMQDADIEPGLDADLDPEDDWKVTETINLNVPLTILKRPKLTYSFGLEKEDTDQEKGEWEPTHTVSLSDDLPLIDSRALELRVGAAYTFEESEEEESDIGFTYHATLEHQISRTARQSLSATREPLDTFGSTADTDSTTYRYGFDKTDLFIRGLSLGTSVEYAINKPLDSDDGDEERTWTYNATVEHQRLLTRSLMRTLSYDYSYEDSNTEENPLEEHRVQLSFEYMF